MTRAYRFWDATLDAYAANLISAWLLEEASGERADAVGANNLTDNNTVGQSTGKNNQAANFIQANSEYLSIADGAQVGLDLVGAFTISCWVKKASPGSVNSFFVAKLDYGPANNKAYAIYYNYATGGVMAWISSNGTDNFQKLSSNALAAGWNHVVMRFTPSTELAVFVNNVKSTLATGVPAAVYNSSAPFQVGAGIWTNPINFWDGDIDEVYVWDAALSDAAIADLYAAGAGKFLADSYTFAQGVGFAQSLSRQAVFNRTVEHGVSFTQAMHRLISRTIEHGVAFAQVLNKKLTTTLYQGISFAQAVSRQMVYNRAIAHTVAFAQAHKFKLSLPTVEAEIVDDGSASYVWVTGDLEDGKYIFAVYEIDDAGNVNEWCEDCQVIDIASLPYSPTAFDFTYSNVTHKPTFTWTAAQNATSYNLYWNSGAGAIDYTTPLAAGVSSPYTPAAACLASKDYAYGLRAENATGEEANTDQRVEFSTDASAHLVEPAPRPVSLFSATAVAAGKIELRALWDDTGVAEGVYTAATQVAFYYDVGTGTIDYNTPLATVGLSANASGMVTFGTGLKAEFTTAALTDGQEYIFAAKAKTAAGSLSAASAEVAATADATEPDAGTLSAEEII